MQSLAGVHGVRMVEVELKICEVHSLHHTDMCDTYSQHFRNTISKIHIQPVGRAVR